MPFSVVVLLILSALGCALMAMFAQSGVVTENSGSVGAAEKSMLTRFTDSLTRLIDGVLRRRGWVPFRASELELAGIRMNQSSIVTTVVAGTFAAFAVGLGAGSVLIAVLLALTVPIVAKVAIRFKASARRGAFADQMESTMQIMSSALRAGHSFPRSLDTVSMEAQPPTSDEFARIINENRIGRDLIDAMRQVAERMDSEDFGWVTDAVSIQRETGGNLSEVLDRVGETIRERNELRQQIHALSAEGRISAIVLMALPILLILYYSLANPGYLDPLVTTSFGRILLVGSAVLYGLGAMWMRVLIKVKL